ncbi:MAG: prolipoprotein diacylglyceryl transferase [Holdemanella sp.]|nr:prolipoprotein diacylglyceryl transferase [Holdemanella sp.]
MVFHFINLSKHLYGLMLGFSFLLSGIVIYQLLKEKVEKRFILYSYLLTGTFIIIGSKWMSFLMDETITSIWDASFNSIGGAIGLIVSVTIYDFIYDKKSHIFLDAYIKVLPLLYSISKLGCFFSGCCHGFIYDGIFHVEYRHGSYFPIQFIESIVFFLLFLYGYKKKDKYTIILICSISKFILDYLRYGHTGYALSINQILCLFIIGVTLLLYYKKNKFIKL